MSWGRPAQPGFWSTHSRTLRSPRGLSMMTRPSGPMASLPAARITALCREGPSAFGWREPFMGAAVGQSVEDMSFPLRICGKPQSFHLTNTIAGHLHRNARERPVPGSLTLGGLDQNLVPSALERYGGGRPVEVVFVRKRGFAGVGDCAGLLPDRRWHFPVVDQNLGAGSAPLALVRIRLVAAAGPRRPIETDPKADRFGAGRPHVSQGVSRTLTCLGQPAVVLPVIHGDGGAHRVCPFVGLAVYRVARADFALRGQYRVDVALVRSGERSVGE